MDSRYDRVPCGDLVAFVDLLGFRSFSTALHPHSGPAVETPDPAGAYARANGLLMCFCRAIDTLCNTPPFTDNIKAYQGSDCVYLKSAIPRVIIQFVKLLYQHCVMNRVLLRGALTYGNIHDLRALGFTPRSNAEFLPIWGDAVSLAVPMESILTGSRFLIDGDIQLGDGRPPVSLREVSHPDIVMVREQLREKVLEQFPNLSPYELQWHRVDAGDVPQPLGVWGLPRSSAEILATLRAMENQYQQDNNQKGLEQVQKTVSFVSGLV